MKKKFAAMAATLLALCFAVFPACDKGGEPNATGSVTGRNNTMPKQNKLRKQSPSKALRPFYPIVS